MTWPIDPTSRDLNYVVVAGIPSPGRAHLSGVRIPYVWEVKPSYGKSGAITVFKGRGILKCTLTITLWEREHFLAWPLFAKALEPPSPTKPLVVEMRHPLLAAAGVKAVSVEEFGVPEKQPDGKFWVSVSRIIEYRPPAPALVKPRGAIPSPEKGKPVAPKTEADLALLEARRAFEDARARASQ